MTISQGKYVPLYFCCLVLVLLLTLLGAATVLADNDFNDFGEDTTITTSDFVSSAKQSSDTTKEIINVSGSSTVSSVLNLIADRFEQRHKEIKINITGGGSSSTLKAMLSTPDTIGQMSRAMKKKERAIFFQHYGYEPLEFKIAVDALAVYVNKHNSLNQLSITQLAEIYAEDSHNINQWGDLKRPEFGTQIWKNRAIRLFSLPQSTGAYSLFKKRVLKKSGYKVSMISYPTSSTVVQAVGVYPGAIAFASSFYKTNRTHFVALQGKDSLFYRPEQQWITSFKYPLARYLYLYVNSKPGTPLPTKIQQLLQFLLADGTQILIQRAGFFPVSKIIRDQQSSLLTAKKKTPQHK